MRKLSLYILVAFLALLMVIPPAWAGTAKKLKYGARFRDEGAAHSTPPSGYGDIYVVDDIPYFLSDAGSETSLILSGTAWSAIADPAGDSTITFANDEITTLSFADVNEDMFHVTGIGAFGNVSVMKVSQATGDATDGTVLEVVAADANVDPLVVSASGKANALVVGQNTGVVTIAGAAEETDALVITKGDIMVSDGDLQLDSGDAIFDEDVSVGGDLAVTGTATIGTVVFTTLNASDIAAASGNLTINAAGSGTVSVGNVSTGAIALTGGGVDIGDGATDTLTITGIIDSDVTLDDNTTDSPKIIFKDSDNEQAEIYQDQSSDDLNVECHDASDSLAVTVGNLSVGTPGVGVISLNGGDLFVSDDVEIDGTLVVDTDLDVNGTANISGAFTFAGTASTNIIILTTGDMQIDDGLFEVDTNEDDTSYVKRAQAAVTGPVFSIVEDTDVGASDDEAVLFIDSDTTDPGSMGILIDSEGATGIEFSDIVTVGDGIMFNTVASYTGQLISVDDTLVGTTGEGIIDIDTSANIASGAAMLRLHADTGTLAGATTGFLAKIFDESVGVATSYAVDIASTSNEALHVGAGKALFDEAATFTAGIVSNGDVDINLSANTEEVDISNSAQDWAAGSGLLQIHGDHAGNTTGDMALVRLVYQGDSINNDTFIEAVDASTGAAANGTTQFKVGADGATTITGVASGTDALTLTAGDIKLTSGLLEMTLGDILMTAGNLGVGNASIETWEESTDLSAIQVGGAGFWAAATTQAASDSSYFGHNAYFDNTNSRWEAISTAASDEAVMLEMSDGVWTFNSEDTAIAGDGAITWIPALTIAGHEVESVVPFSQALYYWVDEFDQGNAADAVDEIGAHEAFWTVGGTNENDCANFANGVGGVLDLKTIGTGDDDSSFIIGEPVIAVDSNPIVEFRFKVDNIVDAVAMVGLVEGSMVEITAAADDDIFLVGLQEENGTSADAAIIMSNDANGGVVYADSGINIANNTYVTVRFDLTDTEDPRVWVNGTEISAGAGTVQAGTTLMPYAHVQVLVGGPVARTMTIDYIKIWQDRG